MLHQPSGPGCGAAVQPGGGSAAPADDDGHGRADDPGQKVVGQRPQPVEEVEAVKGDSNGCVFAGDSALALPAALRYGKRLEARPIFARTVCHSRTGNRPHLSRTGLGGGLLRTGNRSGAPVQPGTAPNPWNRSEEDFFSTSARAPPSWVAPRMHRGSREAAALRQHLRHHLHT